MGDWNSGRRSWLENTGLMFEVNWHLRKLTSSPGVLSVQRKTQESHGSDRKDQEKEGCYTTKGHYTARKEWRDALCLWFCQMPEARGLGTQWFLYPDLFQLFSLGSSLSPAPLWSQSLVRLCDVNEFFPFLHLCICKAPVLTAVHIGK